MKLTAIYRGRSYTLEVDPMSTLHSTFYPHLVYTYYKGILQFEDVPMAELFYEEDDTDEPPIAAAPKTIYVYDEPIATSRATLEKLTAICEEHTWTYETRTRVHIVHPVYEEMGAYLTFELPRSPSSSSQPAEQEFTIHNKISTRNARASREYLTSRGYYDGWHSKTGPQETWYVIETASQGDKIKCLLEPLNYANMQVI